MHLGQAHSWPRPPGDVPGELNVVGEIEGVGLEGPVPGQGDEGEVGGIHGHARRHHPPGPNTGDGHRRHYEPKGDDTQEHKEDFFRAPPPVDERGENGHAAEEGREVQQANEDQRVAEVPESGPSWL